MKKLSKILFVLILSQIKLSPTWAQLGGFNLTETETSIYDASSGTSEKTEAQKQVDEIKRLGGKHIELNVKAKMITGKANEIILTTPPNQRALEAQRLNRLIKYIHSQGLSVGMRPIFFVVGPNNEFPYYETQADGSKKLWWHGNIQPADPNAWFESFQIYLDRYANIAKMAQVEQFTIGAELYSMTVGIEDQWKKYPYGFPGRWLQLLRYLKTKLPKSKIVYDINFTDDKVTGDGFDRFGGELERWRYRLVDLAHPKDPAQNIIWQNLISFWKELDAIGIDMYRSLAGKDQVLPKDYKALVGVLKQKADVYATQLDEAFAEISVVTEVEKIIYFKEIGYRSVDRGFTDPFTYADPSAKVNIEHQAAAYEAFLEAFWAPKWPWFGGVFFWDISVDSRKKGNNDSGFSPLEKTQTESIIKSFFN